MRGKKLLRGKKLCIAEETVLASSTPVSEEEASSGDFPAFAYESSIASDDDAVVLGGVASKKAMKSSCYAKGKAARKRLRDNTEDTVLDDNCSESVVHGLFSVELGEAFIRVCDKEDDPIVREYLDKKTDRSATLSIVKNLLRLPRKQRRPLMDWYAREYISREVSLSFHLQSETKKRVERSEKSRVQRGEKRSRLS